MGKRYRFHCTDGHDAMFDLSGRLVGRQRELRAYAEAAARTLMRGVGAGAEVLWSKWAVEVYDAAGRRRMLLPFTEIPLRRR